MEMKRVAEAALLVAGVAAAGCSRKVPDDARVVAESMHTMYGVMRVERLSPPVASRMMTYVTSALYSGLAAANPGMKSLDGVLNGFPVLPKAESPRDYD